MSRGIRFFGACLLVILIFSCGPLHASITLNAGDDRIESITDLTIDGVVYDATFHHQISPNDLLALYPNGQLPFADNATATLAAEAIRAAVAAAALTPDHGGLKTAYYFVAFGYDHLYDGYLTTVLDREVGLGQGGPLGYSNQDSHSYLHFSYPIPHNQALVSFAPGTVAIHWQVADSPIELTQDEVIFEDARLIIEPGVIVEGNGQHIQILGEFLAIGTAENPIVFRNTVISGKNSPYPVRVELRHCRMDGGQLFHPGSDAELILADSKFIGLSDYIYIWYPSENCIIERNEFIDCGKISVGVNDVECRILNNLFFTTRLPLNYKTEPIIESWGAYGSAAIIVEGNTFMNTDRKIIGLSSNGEIESAKNNFWNTTTITTIKSRVSGSMPVIPFLTEPHPNTPSVWVSADLDSDNDGLSNYEETLVHATDIMDADSDDDGVSDGAEVNTHNTDPNNADSDSDGMPDGWEIEHSLNPNSNTDREADPDDDGVPNITEYTQQINPRMADSDGDQMSDGWELSSGLKPSLSEDATTDTDGDGITNYQEYQRGTDPRKYVLSLKKGWNSIAIARMPNDNRVESIFSQGEVAVVWVWKDGRFVITKELEPLQGYWVYSLVDAEVNINLN